MWVGPQVLTTLITVRPINMYGDNNIIKLRTVFYDLNNKILCRKRKTIWTKVRKWKKNGMYLLINVNLVKSILLSKNYTKFALIHHRDMPKS